MEGFQWLNEPKEVKKIDGGIEIVTKDKTDFWKRTDNGFLNDNGHFLYKNIKGNFTITATVKIDGRVLYDHSGLMIRVDSENWLKSCTEYKDDKDIIVGVVVTNFGYSDWSIQEIPYSNLKQVTYQIERKNNDFFVKAKIDDDEMRDIRTTHLHNAKEEVMVGIMSGSPLRDGFVTQYTNIEIKQ